MCERLLTSSSGQSCLADDATVSQISVSTEAHVHAKLFPRACTAYFLTICEGKKVPFGGCWREESAFGGEGSAERRRREKKSSRDELGGAARRVALQTNNLERLNPVKRRTSPPPSLPRSSSQRDLLCRRWPGRFWCNVMTFAKERIDESPKSS